MLTKGNQKCIVDKHMDLRLQMDFNLYQNQLNRSG